MSDHSRHPLNPYNYTPAPVEKFACTDEHGNAKDVRDALRDAGITEVKARLWEYCPKAGRMVVVDEGVIRF